MKTTKRKVVKKQVRGTEFDSHPKDEKMQKGDLARMHKLLDDIASDKVDGFVYMAAPKGPVTKKGGHVGSKSDGCLYVHNMSGSTIVGNLINALNMPPMILLALASSMMAEDHRHE